MGGESAYLNIIFFMVQKCISMLLYQYLFCPYTGVDRPLGLQDVEVARISRQMAHEGLQKWLSCNLCHFVCRVHVCVILCILVHVVVQNVPSEEVRFSFIVLKCMQVLPVHCVRQSSSLTNIFWRVFFVWGGGDVVNM